MNFVDAYLNRPHFVASLLILGAVLGIIGYQQLPLNLFPDTERPQIAVITVHQGASALDIESDITRPIEKELSALEQIRVVRSTSRDEVSVVTAEYRYSKDLDSASNEVANALDRITSRLPRGTRAPMIFKISPATPAVMTLALTPEAGTHLDLSMVRQIAANQVKDRLLQLPEVANAEVFGAHDPVIMVMPDRDRLDRYGLTAADLQRALTAANANQPAGLIIGDGSQIVLKRTGAVNSVSDIERVVLTRSGSGVIRIGDVAAVRRGVTDPRSAYHGNGRPAIAINIQRQISGNVLDTVVAVHRLLPELERDFPNIGFSVPDSQEGLITVAVSNMQGALRSSILMTIAVLFLFLASGRSLALVGVSLPMTFLLTFGIMWLVGMELNIVTLTAITLAVGMLVDDSIVVVENVQRHLDELGKPVRQAVVDGTKEILLADFSGTVTTVLALTPIVFVGGYVERVLRPLSLTLIIALLSSFIVSVTIIPLLAPWILRRSSERTPSLPERLTQRLSDATLGRLNTFYQTTLRIALKRRALFLLGAFVLLAISALQLPLVGGDLMPPMDTGIIKIAFEADAGSSIEVSERILNEMHAIIKSRPEVVSTSATIGAEAAVVSFGSGQTPRQGSITVNLVDRFHRELSSWDIESELQRQFQLIPGLAQVAVYGFGATPMSTILAPVDVMISGPDLQVLDRLGREVQQRLYKGMQGVTSISPSWRLDTLEAALELDPGKLAIYGIGPDEVTAQISGVVGGMPASTFRVQNQDSMSIWIQAPADDRADLESLETFTIRTARGDVPLAQLGAITLIPGTQVITHQALERTLDIKVFRARRAISHLTQDKLEALDGIELPQGYRISYQGEISEMNEAFGRLAAALGLSVVLLYFALVPSFRSWLHPITIMSVIPFAIIGATWALLIFDRHACMPAMMGMILLAGIVVNNSILLLDFVRTARSNGASMNDALIEAVGVRMRPILMTATSTIVGMIPIAFEWAVGLERLSPLAVVAIGGLLVATFLTMIYVPIVYTLLEDLRGFGQRLIA